MVLPSLSEKERKAALEKAVEVRQARAALRGQIKRGELGIIEVLAQKDEPTIGRMKVSALIESFPLYGKARAASLMEELDIAPSRRVQGLGLHQQENLISRLSK